MVRTISARRFIAALTLVVACLFMLAVVEPSTAHAQAGEYSLTAVVDEVAGDKATISIVIDPQGALVGALEGSLTFDPNAVTPTACDFVGDLGACNPLEDRLRFSALFLDGLSEPTTIMTVTFAAASSDATTVIDFADVAGFDTSTAELSVSTTSASFTTGSASRNPLVVALPVIAIAAVAGFALLALRTRKQAKNRDQ